MIERRERGVGAVATLVAVMTALDFRLTGLRRRGTLGNRLRGQRVKRSLSAAQAVV